MADNRLVPYSVHLKRDVYDKLKLAAGERKASSLVRDAITLIVEGGTTYNGGYNKGVRDSIRVVETESLISGLVINGRRVGPTLITHMEKLIIKEPARAKKTRGD